MTYGNAIQSASTNLEKLSVLTKGLTLDQTLNALSTKNLTKEEIEAILSANGFTSAEYEQAIALRANKTALDANAMSLSAYGTGLKAVAKQKMAALFSSPLTYIALGTAAIYGMVKASNYLHGADERLAKAHEESVSSIKDSISEYKNLESEMEQIKNQRDSNAEKIRELNALKESGSISESDNQYLETLKSQNVELQKKLEYEQSLADIKAKETEKESVKTLQDKTSKGVGHDSDGNAITMDMTDSEKVEQNTSIIEQNTKRLIAYKDALEGSLTQEDIDYFTKLRDASQEALNSAVKANDDLGIQNYTNDVKQLNDILSGKMDYKTYQDGISGIEEENTKLVKSNSDLLDSIEPLNDSIVSTEGANADLKASNDEIISSAKDAANAYDSATNAINDNTDAGDRKSVV